MKSSAAKFIILIFLVLPSCKFGFVIGPWENGIIPYYLKGEFSDTDVANIKTAMAGWENVCGVKFEEVTPRSSAYCIYRVGVNEWSSSVGENNSTCHMVFGKSYSNTGVIMHELGHCLGLEHEHQRPDRDSYVTILWDNILTEKDFNFVIIDNPLLVEQDYTYDYKSIMHYNKYAFSKNGKATIVSKDGTTIDPSETITDLDAAKAQAIYGPPLTSTDE
jgi:hypothetical protein